jgi:protein transport protein SEC23
MLSLTGGARGPVHPGQPGGQNFGAGKFLLPVSTCEFQLTGILEALPRDPWPVASDKRPARCTGVALSVAVGLLEASLSQSYHNIAG